MKKIVITTTTEIDLDELLSQFEKSWNTKFDGSKKTKCMLFEELTFGHHINPSTAMQVVEEVTKSTVAKRTVLRINPRGI